MPGLQPGVGKAIVSALPSLPKAQSPSLPRTLITVKRETGDRLNLYQATSGRGRAKQLNLAQGSTGSLSS